MKNFIVQPWHLLVTALVGIANEEQQHVIEYLCTENQVLKEKLGKKRIMLNHREKECTMRVMF